MKFWQVASGDIGRDYSRLFLDHDVMGIGPGRFGSYDREQYDAVVESGEFSAAKITTVRKFHDDVQIGDIILLRRGHEVVGLGVVDSGYTPMLHKPLRGACGDLRISRRIAVVCSAAGDVGKPHVA